jgi:hypothetical protein
VEGLVAVMGVTFVGWLLEMGVGRMSLWCESDALCCG